VFIEESDPPQHKAQYDDGNVTAGLDENVKHG
jgi:hypothetical protein